MKTVEFAYDIGETVHIADYPDIRGRVVGLCVRVWGTTYCVCWWQDGKRFEEWLHDWELGSVKSNAPRQPEPASGDKLHADVRPGGAS